MPVSQPDLSVSLDLVNCTGLTVTDSTGVYDSVTNPLGYGLPGGPSVNDITSVTLTLRYSTLSADLVYVFTVLNGVITAATVAFAGGTPGSILSVLTSTTWPLTEFDVTLDRNITGVTLPDFDDDVFKLTYVIEGSVPDDFEFTSIVWAPVSCTVRCCVDKLWRALDPCDCNTSKLQDTMTAESQIMQFEKASEVGDLTAALAALDAAQTYCEDCGC